MNPTPVSLPFTDRAEAGRRLAERVRAFAVTDPIIVALPRGGVPVGAELARRLRVPLDVLLVRKIGLPSNPEFGVGALTEDGRLYYDDTALARMNVSREALAETVESERAELHRRLALYRGGRPAPRLGGRDVIVVDDGLATGGTARAALAMVRRQRPARLVLAVPVGHLSAVEGLRHDADQLVVLTAPENFRAVGEWYRDFEQLTDGYVTAVLAELGTAAPPGASERAVRFRAGEVYLDCDYAVPPQIAGTVVMAVEEGRSHPQHRAVARALREHGFATLLLDVLTAEERQSQGVGAAPGTAVLAERLEAAVRWLRRAAVAASDPVGLLGVGAGAVAAVTAAAHCPDDVGAVVTCGGRLDFAEEALPDVRAPTLVLVEGEDSFVRELAEWAAARMSARQEVRVVAGPERLLTDPRSWEEVGAAAVGWYRSHLSQ